MRTSIGKKNFKKGMSLVEAVIALGIFSVVVTPLYSAIFIAHDSTMNDSIRLAATRKISDLLEKDFFRQFVEENNSGNDEDNSKGDPEDGSIDGIVATKRNISPCLIRLEKKISWKYISNHNADNSILIPDISEGKKLNNDCGGYPDYKKDAVIQIQDLYSYPDVEATGIDIQNGRYFASLISSAESSPDIVTGSFMEDNGSVESLDIGTGLNSLDAAGQYVFGAHKSSHDQLVVIKASNDEPITLSASSTLPGVAGMRPEGWSIFYYDSRVYIGTKRTAGHEFHIFDVSDPLHPTWLGSREINHNVNGIAVQGGLAFLATSGNSKDVIVLGVMNPSAIIQTATLDLPGSEDGRSLALLGDTLYVGRFKSIAGNPDFYILDVAGVMEDGTFSIVGSFKVGADVNSVKIAGDLALLGTSKTGATFQILNIASSTDIVLAGVAGTSQKITSIDYEDNNFAGAVFGGENIVSFDLSETQ